MKSWSIITAVLLAAGITVAAAEETAKLPKIFTTEEVIAATLDAPWRDIVRENRGGDRSWQGQFSYHEGGHETVIPVTITRRGLTRQRICDFPPLRLDFDREASKGTRFRGAGNLKLVTHCFDNKRYSQYYVKEFLAYRLYNAVTPLSFRVQGLDVTYLSNGARPTQRFAFLIEDPDDIAKRNGLEKLSIPETRPSELDPAQTSRYVVFQYLIANLDWAVISGPGDTCCHNARLLGGGPSGLIQPVPYDLDSSGLVDAHYAAPPANLRVRSVRDRLFRGFCAHNEALDGVLQEYRDLRPAFMAIFEGESRLDPRHQKDALRFMEKFYDVIDDPKAVRRELIGNCRG